MPEDNESSQHSRIVKCLAGAILIVICIFLGPAALCCACLYGCCCAYEYDESLSTEHLQQVQREDGETPTTTTPILQQQDDSNTKPNETRREYLIRNMIVKAIVPNHQDEKTDSEVYLCDVIQAKFKSGSKDLIEFPQPPTNNDKIPSSSGDGYNNETDTIIDEEKMDINTENDDITHDDDSRNNNQENNPPPPQSSRNIQHPYDGIVDSDDEDPIEIEINDSHTIEPAARPSPSASETQGNSTIIESNRSNTSIIDSLRSNQGPIKNIISSARSIRKYITTSRRNDPCCSICLDEYQVGDEICWSKNQVCVHIHHLDCMLEWLQDHDDCPLCRETFVLRHSV